MRLPFRTESLCTGPVVCYRSDEVLSAGLGVLLQGRFVPIPSPERNSRPSAYWPPNEASGRSHAGCLGHFHQDAARGSHFWESRCNINSAVTQSGGPGMDGAQPFSDSSTTPYILWSIVPRWGFVLSWLVGSSLQHCRIGLAWPAIPVVHGSCS